MKKFLLAFLLISGAARAQLFSNPIKILAADPSGACAPRTMGLSVASGNAFYCRPDTSMWSAGMGSGGTGTVTNSGTLTANSVLVGNGGVSTKVSKLSCTGTPVTCILYDDTAITGASKIAIRVGAAQTNHTTCTDRLWSTFDNNGTDVLSEIDCAGSFAVNDWNNAFKKKVGLATNISGAGTQSGVGLASNAMVTFKSVDSLDTAGTYDAGLCRGAAGQINVNDGSATCANYRQLYFSGGQVYDSTPTTGDTTIDFRAGASQSSGGELLRVRNNANQIVAGIDSLGALYTQEGATGKFKSSLTAANGPNGSDLNLSSDSSVKFNSTDNVHTGADDTGICRASAGVLNVFDGSSTCANLAALATSAIKTGSSPPSVTPGTGGVPFACAEGTVPSVGAAAGVDIVYCDAALHQPLVSVNGGPYIPTVATTTITTGATATLATPFTVNQEATAASGVTYTLPTAASGLQFCIDNGYNGSAADTGILTLATSATGQFMVFTDGTLTATGGNVTSAGAARDGACVYGIDSTHWMFLPHSGTWTKH